MTELGRLIARRIVATGPMTVADYMAECLLHPRDGYYMADNPLGRGGDFTTAPEISQMFGELLGLCMAQAWMDQGRPTPVVLAELGPGRGTLMADMLRATAAVPGFRQAVSVHLVEASPVLRAAQAETLAGRAPAWHDRVDELPEGPLFLVANEFFDALPVRQFHRDPQGWRERHVTLKGETLAFGLSEPAPVAALDHRLADTEPGEVVELRAGAEAIMGEIAGRIARNGGAAVIVDYGDWRSRGDTLQAVRGHRAADPLAEPGAADLTAHVDFEALAAAAAGAAVAPLTPQGVLLERLGITARAETLAGGLSGAARAAHVDAHRRLVHPDAMGRLFKALAIYPEGAPMPSGFAS